MDQVDPDGASYEVLVSKVGIFAASRMRYWSLTLGQASQDRTGPVTARATFLIGWMTEKCRDMTADCPGRWWRHPDCHTLPAWHLRAVLRPVSEAVTHQHQLTDHVFADVIRRLVSARRVCLGCNRELLSPLSLSAGRAVPTAEDAPAPFPQRALGPVEVRDSGLALATGALPL